MVNITLEDILETNNTMPEIINEYKDFGCNVL